MTIIKIHNDKQTTTTKAYAKNCVCNPTLSQIIHFPQRALQSGLHTLSLEPPKNSTTTSVRAEKKISFQTDAE